MPRESRHRSGSCRASKTSPGPGSNRSSRRRNTQSLRASIARRCQGDAAGVQTPLGIMPRFEDLTWTGIESKLTPAQYAELAGVDRAAWKEELASHDELFAKLGSHLPEALETRRGEMHGRLTA